MIAAMKTINTPPPRTPEPRPWRDRVSPARREWTEEEYLDLSTNRLVEFSDGRLEVLPMPTQSHELIVFFLSRLLVALVEVRAPGTVLPAGLRVRLWARKYRQPDGVFMLAEHNRRRHDRYWEGADLVMEVVSPDPKDRKRDLETKRREYARAGIPEYWIVDPLEQRILVLTLRGGGYQVHGEFGRGMEASSLLLPDFHVPVDDVFAAASA